MSIRYGQKITPASNKRISSSFVGYNRDYAVRSPYPTNSTARSSELLTPPTISSSEQKMALLVFLSNDSSNFLAFTIAGNYTVDWGDGTVENISSGVAANHIYDYSTFDPTNTTLTSAGFKQAWVIVTPQAGANITSINFQVKHSSALAANYYSQPIKEIYISAPNLTSLTLGTNNPIGTIYPRYCSYVNLINTGSLTSFSSLMYGMYSLVVVDIGTTAAVTNMAGMFINCASLLDVRFSSNANLASCTSTASMFYNCYSLVTLSLFNTIGVTNMANMFYQCYSLYSIPAFNTANVTSTNAMFQYCYSLEIMPPLNLGKVTDMGLMFNACYSLKTVPQFNTSSATTMSSMFNSCYSLTSVPMFNTINVLNMSYMFSSCYSLQSVPAFNTGNVTNMTNMFNNCYSLHSVGLMNTVKVTDMSNMFYNCFSLISIPLFNTAAVTTMAAMFQYCYNLVSVPLLNTAAVTSMNGMFHSCFSLTTIPLFNTANVINMAGMFGYAYSLINVPAFNTIKVTTFNGMFFNNYSLLTIPTFNTAAVTDITNTFYNCYSLASVPAWSLSAVNATPAQTFYQCLSLASINFTGYKYGMDFSNCKLAKAELETVFANLGTAAVGATRTLTLTNNWGAPTPVSLSGTTTAGSVTISMANTTGLAAGMQVTGTNTSLTTGRSVTFTDAGDLVNLTAHGLSDGDEVSFSSITSTTGIVINTIYFVVNSTTDNFQVAATVGGSALPLTTNGSGTLKYNSTIVSIVTNTSVTMSRPMAGSATQTLAFRQLGTYKAILKGFAITG